GRRLLKGASGAENRQSTRGSRRWTWWAAPARGIRRSVLDLWRIDQMGETKRSGATAKRAWKDALELLEQRAAKASAEIEMLMRESLRQAGLTRDTFELLVDEAAASSRSAHDQILDNNSRLVQRVESRVVEAEERFATYELAVSQRAEHAHARIASRSAEFADEANDAAAALHERVRLHAGSCRTPEGELRDELQRVVERIRSDAEQAAVETLELRERREAIRASITELASRVDAAADEFIDAETKILATRASTAPTNGDRQSRSRGAALAWNAP